MLNGELSSTVFGDTVDEDFTALYPSIISAFQIGDQPLIGKIMSDNPIINERFGELLNERNIVTIGNLLLNLPTVLEVYKDLDKILK